MGTKNRQGDTKKLKKNPTFVEKSNCEYKSISNIQVIYFNARSIVNKRYLLDVMLKSENFSLVLITETWLKESLPDSLIVDTKHYCIIRNDRTERIGGGVAAIYPRYLAHKISLVEVNHSFDGFNLLAFDLFSTDRKYFRFIVVYVPPDSSHNPVIVQNLLQLLTSLKTKSDLYIFGDFNFNDIKWYDIKSSKLRLTSEIFS